MTAVVGLRLKTPQTEAIMAARAIVVFTPRHCNVSISSAVFTPPSR